MEKDEVEWECSLTSLYNSSHIVHLLDFQGYLNHDI
jgi:hypothetical protein